jgi:N6-adenosine-specific RNA methylase IME4
MSEARSPAISKIRDWPFGDIEPCGFELILADPPWRFRTWNETNQKKSASRHYSLMMAADIRALPVRELAAKDCALVLWAVQAMVPQALDVMKAWGFAFKSMGAWAKLSKTGRRYAFGTGYIYRSAAEFYILGTIGKPKVAARNVRNLIVEPVRSHSQKPDRMHYDLEQLFPNARKIELFGRQNRKGWTVWGDQSDKFDLKKRNQDGAQKISKRSDSAQLGGAGAGDIPA